MTACVCVMSTNGDGGHGEANSDEKYIRVWALLQELKAHVEATDRKVERLCEAEERGRGQEAGQTNRREAEERGRGQEAGQANRREAEERGRGQEAGQANRREAEERGRGQEAGKQQSKEGAVDAARRKLAETEAQKSKEQPRQGPGPAELEGEGWHDSKTEERGR